MPIQILTIESEPFAENSYLVWREGSKEAFVIDPGFEPDLIREALADNDLTLAAIVCTHGHVDHIAGNAESEARLPERANRDRHARRQVPHRPVVNMSAVYSGTT